MKIDICGFFENLSVIFMKIDICGFFRKSVEIIEVSLKSDKNKRFFT